MNATVLYRWRQSICEDNTAPTHTHHPGVPTTMLSCETPFVSDEFCCELASSLAVMLLEFNAELEEFCFQIDNLDRTKDADLSELEVVR